MANSSSLSHTLPDDLPRDCPAALLVQIKRKHVERLTANQEKIRSFFCVELQPVSAVDSGGPLASYMVVPVPGGNNNNGGGNPVRNDELANQPPAAPLDNQPRVPDEPPVTANPATMHSGQESLAQRVQVGRLGMSQ